MRIRLNYLDGYIYASAFIDIPKLRIRMRPLAKAIIDTGSPETILGEGMAMQLGMPLNTLKFVKNANIGGIVYELFELGEVGLKFVDTDNKPQTFLSNDMFAARSTKKDERSKQVAQSMPAILGTNFLLKNRLSLHFTPHKNETYLERED